MKILKWPRRYSCHLRDNQRKIKGAVLIMATWALFFLSSLALLLGFFVRPQVSFANKLKNRTQARNLAETGVARVLAEMAQDQKGKEKKEEIYTALNQSWNNQENLFKDVVLGDGFINIYNSYSEEDAGRLKYGLIDEDRKININQASQEVLQRILELSGGVSELAAKDMAASMAEWRGVELVKGEGCRDQDYYKSLSMPYSCKRKDFEILDELLLVKGMTRSVFNKIKNYLTIYGSGSVNINTADRIVLQSLGAGSSLADKILHLRNGEDDKAATEDDHIFKSTDSIVSELVQQEALTQEEETELTNLISAGSFTVNSESFSGVSVGQIKSNGISARVEFVVSRSHQIKFWREE